MTTDQRLRAAAAALLDAGGESTVTLRAVAAATGLSHNAPYKHFASRGALLAAVAAEDFRTLGRLIAEARRSGGDPVERLRGALEGVLRFSERHPGRYQLLLRSPLVAAHEGSLEAAARGAFRAFAAIVEDGQAAGVLPAAPSGALAGLVFATLNGLIDAEGSGRLEAEKGLDDVRASLDLLLRLLSQRPQAGE